MSIFNLLNNTKYRLKFYQYLIELRLYIIITMFMYILMFIITFTFIENFIHYIMHIIDLSKAQFISINLSDNFLLRIKLGLAIAFIFFVPLFSIILFCYLYRVLSIKTKLIFVISSISISLLFTAGILIGYFYVSPRAIDFLLLFTIENVKLHFTIYNYVYFVVKLCILFGLCMQLPFIIYFLSKLHIINIVQLKKFRKNILFIFFIIAAVITPPDPISQIIMALILYILYEISIILVRYL